MAYKITDLKEVLAFKVKHSLVGQFMTTENEIPPRNSSIAQYEYMSDVVLGNLMTVKLVCFFQLSFRDISSRKMCGRGGRRSRLQ